MKSVLLSIQPQWCKLIASGKKTIDVRKTKPKLDTPFKCYIYCTNKKTVGDLVFINSDELKKLFPNAKIAGINKGFANPSDFSVKGKVIGEFVCDYITTIFFDSDIRYGEDFPDRCISSIDASCLSLQELKKYSNGNDIYGWHISDLIIYDKPRELQEFYVEDTVSIKQCEYRVRAAQPASVTDYNGWIKGANICTKNVDTQWCENCITKPLTRPPMSWCYVEGLK